MKELGSTSGRLKNTRKNTKKAKTIMNKSITNTIKKERGGFDYPEMALRERNNTKVGSRRRGRTPKRSRPLGRRPLVTQQKKKVERFDSPKMAPRETNNTKGGLRKTIKSINKLKTTKKNTINNITKKEGGGLILQK
jgi:hypothetical protein